MGVQVVAKGVDAEQYATEYSAPVRRGLEGIFFTNGSLEKAARNYAPNKQSGSIVGAPTVNSGYISLKGGANYIQTPILETESVTMFIIARQVPDPANPGALVMFCGNYAGGPFSGVSMYVPAAGRLTGTAGYGNDDVSNSNSAVSVTPISEMVWGLYSVTISPTLVVTRSHTANLSGQVVQTLPRRPSTRPVRIGWGYSAAHLGWSDVALYQHHSVGLTDDERAKTVADLRAYAARRGIMG